MYACMYVLFCYSCSVVQFYELLKHWYPLQLCLLCKLEHLKTMSVWYQGLPEPQLYCTPLGVWSLAPH